MIGAITGDIVGSIYEGRNIKTKEFPLFGEGCRFYVLHRETLLKRWQPPVTATGPSARFWPP